MLLDIFNSRVTPFLVLLLLLLFCLGIQPVTSALDVDIDRLVNDLRSNYTIYARPPRDQSLVTTVQVSFQVLALREFDEVNGRFSVIGTTIIGWADDRVMWDPAEYNGVTDLLVDNNVFWTPPIFLQNSLDEFKRIGADSYWKVRYTSSGYAVFYPGDSFTSVCPVTVDDFPWDTQTCPLIFSVSGYQSTEINLIPFLDEYIKPLEYFLGDGLWDFLERDTTTTNNSVLISYNLRRKPLLSIINIIVPIVFMSFLNITVFLIPVESGERVSFCLTVLLAIAVFLTLVSDSMPKSATSIALLSYYLVAVLALSIVITMVTILNLKLYFRDEESHVPACLQTLSRRLLCKRRRKRDDHVGIRIHNTTRDHEHEVARKRVADESRDSPTPTHDPDNNKVNGARTTRNPVYYGKQSADGPEVRTNGQVGLHSIGVYDVTYKTRPLQNGGPFNLQMNQMAGNQTWGSSAADNGNSYEEEPLKWKHVSSAFDIILFVVSLACLLGMTFFFFIEATS